MARKRAEQSQTVEEATPPTPEVAREPGEEGPARQYPPEPNPRSWAHHNQVGVQLRSRREPYQAELVFNEKPSQPVIDYIKEQGFRWDSKERIWARPESYATQSQDRLMASRTYHRVVDMLLLEKGLEPTAGQTPF